MNIQNQLVRILPYLGLLLVFAAGARIDVMEVDAAQYANMSLEMLYSNNWLQVFDGGKDYLDKPPLLFWLSAISFKLFGIGNWQYKLPSILFSLLGIYSTQRLGELLYDKKVGRFAGLILGSSVAFIIINNDVKTDTILVSAIVFSIWMMVSAIKTNKLKYFVGAALGITTALLTKGPIGLMMPLVSVGGHILLSRQWKMIVNWRWLVLISLVIVGLVPMCIGLYDQHGAEGLKFYFWTQSFGRITGESNWQNDTSPLFFFGQYVWSFLPWILLGVAAVFNELRQLSSKLKSKDSEYYLISGIALVWLALSLSKFKLPHYIFVVYPLISILTSKYIVQLKLTAGWAWIQLILSAVMTISLAAGLTYVFPSGSWLATVLLAICLLAGSLFFFNFHRSGQLVWPSFVMTVGIGLALNLHFYPELLKYQASSMAGKWLSNNSVEMGNVYGFAAGGRSMNFYAQHQIPWLEEPTSAIEVIEPGTIIYTNHKLKLELEKRGYPARQERVFEDFRIQILSIDFLNPETRSQAVNKKYLLFY
jgi:4-amino-4-deoxy-L-arabinose transferase-like glycosyltransferase